MGTTDCLKMSIQHTHDGLAEQLDAAADAQHDGPARGGRVQRVALARDEVLGAQELVAVLAAAQVEEVVGVGVDAVA